jgi:hypothetical protein
MPHLDEDELALLALGEQHADLEVTQHLDGCERCSKELQELSRVVTAGRANADVMQSLTAPAPHVWDGIAAAAGIAATSRAHPAEDLPARGAVTPLRPPAPRRGIPTWLSVAAGVAIGVAGAVAVQALDNEAPTPENDLIASATLAEFGSTGTTGIAEIRQRGDARVVQVSLDEPAEGGDFREVWLLDTEAGALISLGVLNGTESSFELPDDLDLRDFPTVDISREPLDGDPAHSADSIARGELEL